MRFGLQQEDGRSGLLRPARCYIQGPQEDEEVLAKYFFGFYRHRRCECLPDVSATQANNPGAIDRPHTYGHGDFRVNLIRQLADLDIAEPPPKRRYTLQPPAPIPAAHLHLPRHQGRKKNCVFCWETEKRQRQCVTACDTCGVHLHSNERNCFLNYHQVHF